MDLARTVAMMILSIVLPLGVQLADRQRMDAQRRARTWNIATWACALYAFGPLSMLGWIFVTRPRWLRCIIAPLWTLPLLGSLVLFDHILEVELKGQSSQSILPLELLESAVLGYVALVATLFIIELIILLRRYLANLFGTPPEPAHDGR
jgi:hypothetical protein